MLEIRLLGEQRVVDDESVVTAAQSPRVIGLLAQLALNSGKEVTRSRIADLFWPDSTSEQALTNLRRELHQLRKALPRIDSCLVTDARTLRWTGDAHCSLDVVTFLGQVSRARTALRDADTATFVTAATQAVSSYGGAFLPASYDDWVLEERENLRRRCVELLTGLVNATRESDLGSAMEHARRRVELEPLEEVGYRDLMGLHATAGDRAAALRTYHRCASILERELGVAPDPMTTALYDKLVAGAVGRGENALRLTSHSERSPRLPLIGRDQPLGELSARWTAASQGRASLHLLTGDSGVGKTRLVDELAVIAERGGASVARARCFAGRARLAMAPVAEWLASPELRAQQDHLDPVWAAEVDRLVPVAGASRTRPEPMVDAWQRHRFFEGLARAVLAPERPMLLILDDLQWCDEDTLVWIQLLLRLGHQHPLLVIAAARTDDVDANEQLSEVLSALKHEDLMTSSELAPLDVESTIRLAELLGADGLEAKSVHAATGGYPLFVIESARAGRASPGDTLADHLPRAQQVLAGRLAQLSADAHDVARLASVVGRDFSLELLAEASDLDADTVLDAVDELWRRRIVAQHRGSTYDFAHDLLREAAYREVTPPKRVLLHRRIAQALELVYADDLRPVSAAIADHYEHASMTERAVQYHIKAAEAASDLFANDNAIRHYTRAIELERTLPPSPRRDRTELSICYAMSAPLNAQFGYASKRVHDAVMRSNALAERLGEDRLHLMSLVGLFSVLFVQGRTRESYDVGRRALELSPDHPDVIGQAHFAVAGPATSLGHLAEALEHFAVVPGLTMDLPPALVGTRTEVHSQAWSAHAQWLVGRRADAVRTNEWAVARARDVDHPYSLAVALAYATMTAQFDEDRDAVVDLSEQTRQLCDRYSFAYYGEWAAILGGWAKGGASGTDSIRRGLRGLDRQGAMARRPYFLALLADCLQRAGRTEDAVAVLDSACSIATAHQDVWWLPEVLRMKALVGPEGTRAKTLGRALRIAEGQGSRVLADRLLGVVEDTRPDR